MYFGKLEIPREAGKNMRLRIRKRPQMELLVQYIFILPFLFFFLMDLCQFPSVVKYTVDVAWLLLLAAMLAVRFIGTRYVYKITFGALGDGELSVSELRGFFGKSSDVKSCRTVCRVGLFDVKEATVFERGDESRTKIKEMKKRIRRERAAVYNYLPDVFADKYALLRIENGDGISYLKLSPDGELMRIIGK